MRLSRFIVLVSIGVGAWGQNPFTLSEKDEIELGRHAAGEIEKDIRLIEDAEVVKYIGELGNALVEKSARKGITYTFKVVNSPEINAFALPGGFIYVNRGLIEAAENEDELAGVLGHEIGHVVARHGADQAARAGLVQTGLGVLGGLLGRGTASSVGQTAAKMVTTGVFMKFSREAERDADRLGARMLSDAQLQPRGMVSFFDKLAGLQKSQPNSVQKFFSSHPSPTERSQNLSELIATLPTGAVAAARTPGGFLQVKQRLAAMPRPEVEAAKLAQALAAAAKPPHEPPADVRARNLARDREIAARFAPSFYQALGPTPRFDYITNFDFDGDWRGDNNWNNADDRRFALKAYVYYAVFETRTHFLIHYAAFHPRDYKGGDKGAALSQAMRIGAALGSQYDPTGRSSEAVMAHENDLEGALIVAEKNGEDPGTARLLLVETLAHNNYLKYVPAGSQLAGEPVRLDGVQPQLFVEPKGHGIEAWCDDAFQRKQAEKGFLTYKFTGSAQQPEDGQNSVGYDLLPTFDTFWEHARAGKGETCGEEHDYGVVTVRFTNAADEAEHHIRVGVRGSALNGVIGAANMSRPPWGWFNGEERSRPLGEWFLQPAETVRRRWNLPEAFSTTYIYNPFLGQFR